MQVNKNKIEKTAMTQEKYIYFKAKKGSGVAIISKKDNTNSIVKIFSDKNKFKVVN